MKIAINNKKEKMQRGTIPREARRFFLKGLKHTGWRVVHAGGNVNNGDNAGFAALNANNSASNRNTNTGSHVCFTSHMRTCFKSLALAKTEENRPKVLVLFRKTLAVKQTVL
jgi:hypothetical protein